MAYGAFSERVAKERIKEFHETGAEVLITACPNCQEIFSGLLAKEKGKVKDLIEMVEERTEASHK